MIGAYPLEWKWIWRLAMLRLWNPERAKRFRWTVVDYGQRTTDMRIPLLIGKTRIPYGIHTVKCVGVYLSRDTYTGVPPVPRVFLQLQTLGNLHFISDLPVNLFKAGASSEITRAFGIPYQLITIGNIEELLVGRWTAIEIKAIRSPLAPSTGMTQVRLVPTARECDGEPC